MPPDVDILSTETCYQGFFRIDRYRLRHRLFKGGWSRPLTREVFERGHAVAVLPYDPQRDEVVLIEQFRIGALAAHDHAWLLEIAAGIIEPGEDPLHVAHREVREETGCIIETLQPICTFYCSPGGTSETIALYCACVDASGCSGIHGLADEGEDIRVSAIPFSRAVELLEQGRLNSASIIIALQWLMQQRDRLRKEWG